MKSSIHPSDILAIIDKLPGNGKYWLAYSGGLDSTVLLYLLVDIKKKCSLDFTAIHVNHNISKYAERWANHCKSQCDELGVPFICKEIDVSDTEGKGLEAFAREKRYKAIGESMENNDILLTAHHRDDLAETVLLQLFRGAGPDGLSGIPFCREFLKGWIARPMLGFNRAQIMEYALDNKLPWIDDESNEDHVLDRNYIRRKVMPVIQEHWPSVSKTIARAARHQAEVSDILSHTASVDLERVRVADRHTLDVEKLQSLDRPRLKNVLRYWIRVNQYDTPNEVIMDSIINEMIHASPESTPRIHWRDTELRRYKKKLYLLDSTTETDRTLSCQWNLNAPLDIGQVSLRASRVTGKGIRVSSIKDDLVDVRFRQGGEKIRPAGRKETHDLKKLFQEKGIPPWERSRIPLLFVDGKLAAVAGFWVEDSFSAGKDEEAWDITISL